MKKKVLLWILAILATSFLTCNATDAEKTSKVTKGQMTNITIYPHLFGYKWQRSGVIHETKIPSEIVFSNITINGTPVSPSEITKQAIPYSGATPKISPRRWLKHYFEKIVIPTTETSVTLQFDLSYSYQRTFKRDYRYKKKWNYNNIDKVDQVTFSITTDKKELYLGYSVKNSEYLLQEEPNYISVGKFCSYIIPDGLFD